MFSRNYFSKVSRSQPAKPAQKHNLTRNSQSGSFKVMYFGNTEKPTTDCVSPYNNAGLICKVSEKIACENAESWRRWQPHCRFSPLPRELPRISAKPYTTRNQTHWPTLLPLIVLVYLHSNFCGGLRKTHLCSATECLSVVQGHPRSLILAKIERAYATSY